MDRCAIVGDRSGCYAVRTKEELKIHASGITRGACDPNEAFLSAWTEGRGGGGGGGRSKGGGGRGEGAGCGGKSLSTSAKNASSEAGG